MSHYHARTTFLSTVTFVVVLHLLLPICLESFPHGRDPEYARKRDALRLLIRENPEKPLTLFLGSSRVGMGLRPHADPQSLVFNFAICGARPVMQYLTWKRLRADGIRPQRVFVEYWPPFLSDQGVSESLTIDPIRLRLGEQSRLGHFASPLLLWVGYRRTLGALLYPEAQPTRDRLDFNWRGLDRWGWLEISYYRNGGPGSRWAQNCQNMRRMYAPTIAPGYRIRGEADQALRRLIASIRKSGAEVKLLWMPDVLQYSDEVESVVAKHLKSLDVTLENQRDAMPAESFADAVHLSHGGAKDFTELTWRRWVAACSSDGP